MKKITQGGMLGHKLRQNRKTNILKGIMVLMIAFISIGSYASIEHTKVTNIIASSSILATAGVVLTGEEKEKQDALLAKIKEQTDTATKGLSDRIDELKTKGTADEKTIKALEDKIKDFETKISNIKEIAEFKTLIKEFGDLSTKVNAISEKGNENTPRSYKDALNAAIEEKRGEIDAILKNGGKQSGPLRFEIKAAVTMGMDNTIEAVGSASHYTLTSNTGIISTLRKRIMRYLESVAVGGLSIDRPYAMWIEELDEQGAPIFIGEGDDKTQLSVRYEEREAKAKKIAVYGKVTTEMLRYLPQLINYIKNNLMKRMDIKTEDQLFNGDNTGDNLKGIIPYATAFDGGVGVAGGAGLVGAVESANNYDVIRAIALQVENSYGIPTKIFVLPEVIAAMDVAKDAEGRYLLPPFKTANGTTIAGIELVGTTALNGTGVDFVGGDLSVVNVSFLQQSAIQIGLDGNDFTKNKKTILVEQELVQFVSANDTQVLVKGTFAAAIALINKA